MCNSRRSVKMLLVGAPAVLLVGYELRLAALEDPPPDPLPAIADQRSREAMYAHLESALLTIGFIDRGTSTVIMRRLRRLLGRTEMTPLEVKMIRGLARQILWAADEAGLERADGPSDDRTEPERRS